MILLFSIVFACEELSGPLDLLIQILMCSGHRLLGTEQD